MTISQQILVKYRDAAKTQKIPLPDGFVDAVCEWVITEHHLVTFGTDDKGTFIIVVGQVLGSKEVIYEMIRAFPLGDKWGISIDNRLMDAEKMIHELTQTLLKLSK